MPPLAELWIAAMNGPRTWAGRAAVRVVAWLVRDDTSRFCSRAPTVAVPITRPTWRTVFSTPDAAPAIRGSMFRMAVVTIGANVQPMPNPATISAGRKSYHAELGFAIRTAQPIPAPGATNIEMSEAGAIVRPAFSAEKPRTDCR